MGYPNFQESIHWRPWHHKRRFPHSTLGQGTRWPRRYTMQLISSNAPLSTHTNQLTRYLRGRTTGIDTPWHLLVPRPSYTKMLTGKPHVHPTILMPGSPGPRSIITAATSITSLRLVATACPAPLACFPNIASPQRSHPSHMCRSWQMSYKQHWQQCNARDIPRQSSKLLRNTWMCT